VIVVDGLWKRYHTHKANDWVLRDLNFTIPSGVSVGLIGSNGAGKSTLLRLIAGIDTPDRGSVQRFCRVSWPIGLGGGFQRSLTGRQNIKFVARIHGATENVDDLVARVIEFAEIGSAIDKPLSTYSRGMAARLRFGLSLAFDFDVYLSDEATAVGDRAFRKKAAQAFKERVGRSSLIIVSHAEGILRELCQAGLYVEHGSAHWFDNINEALDCYSSV
jgi:capsular polysaccharide transport system ATP-binding protein